MPDEILCDAISLYIPPTSCVRPGADAAANGLIQLEVIGEDECFIIVIRRSEWGRLIRGDYEAHAEIIPFPEVEADDADCD